MPGHRQGIDHAPVDRDADQIRPGLQGSEQRVVVTLPVTQSPAVAPKHEPGDQHRLNVTPIDEPGVSPGLEVAKGMTFQGILEGMNRQGAGPGGPRHGQCQTGFVAQIGKVDLPGHCQKGKNHPPALAAQDLAQSRSDGCRLSGGSWRDRSRCRPQSCFADSDAGPGLAWLLGHPVTIKVARLTSVEMRLLQTFIRTVLTLSLGVVSTLIAGPAVILIARVNPASPAIERIARAWSRLWLATSGCPLDVQGAELVDPGRSYVVVANHLSVLDIMACFLAVPIPIRFLAKKELFRIPVLAPAMRAIGIVEVDRSARSSIHEQVNRQARELVASGRSLIIYPEGTRSRDGELRSFKKGAFTMAVAGGIPVLPLTIAGTYRAWPPGRLLVNGGRTIKAVIDPPIETAGMRKQDVTALTEATRTIIEKRYMELGGKDA